MPKAVDLKNRSEQISALAVFAIVLACLVLTGCGGGAPVAPSITIQPQNQTVTAPASASFSVTATGSAPLSYQWNENGVAINDATAASYTTPATTGTDNGAKFTVTITNSAGKVTSSSATLTVNVVTVSVTPSSINVLLGDTQQFTASVTNSSNTSVNWSVNGIAGGNLNVGTISSAGLYTAPADLPSPATVIITATSQANTSATANASVTVASDVKIALSTSLNGTLSVQTNATVQMTATITSAGHPDASVTWSLIGAMNGNSTFGTITAVNGGTATYIAPATLPTPNTVTVQVTSVADPGQSASVPLRIDIPVQQYYSETDSNGLASFTLSAESSNSQATRTVIHPDRRITPDQSTSSGSTLTIEAIDQNSQAPVEGLDASLFTDPDSDAVVILSDPAGRYYLTPQILELPTTATANPIQVPVPPIVPPAPTSSTGTEDVNTIQALTADLRSLLEQAWEDDSSTFGWMTNEQTMTLGQLINGPFGAQIQSEIEDEAKKGVVDLEVTAFENAGAVSPQYVSYLNDGEAPFLALSVWNNLESLIYSEVFFCEGYLSSDEMQVTSLGIPLLGNLNLFVLPSGDPSGTPPCSASPGSITGSVVNAQTGNPIASAMLIAQGPTPALAFSAQDGSFSLPNLLPGSYVVSVTGDGYVGQQTSVQLASGQALALSPPIALQPLPFYQIQIQTTGSTILAPNGQVQLTAVALDSSGNPVSPQPTFQWQSQSGNPPAATVGLYTGLVQAVSVGSAEIWAQADDVYSNAVFVTVESQAPEISSIQRITYESPLIDSLPPNQFPRGGTYTAIIQGSGLASMDSFSTPNANVTGTVISATDTQVNVLIASTPVKEDDTVDAPIPSVSFDLSSSLGSLDSVSVTLDIVAAPPPQVMNFQITNGVTQVQAGTTTTIQYAADILSSGNAQFFYVGCGLCQLTWGPSSGGQFLYHLVWTDTATIPPDAPYTTYGMEVGAVDGAGQGGVTGNDPASPAQLTIPEIPQ
jgi:hypothetical protein